MLALLKPQIPLRVLDCGGHAELNMTTILVAFVLWQSHVQGYPGPSGLAKELAMFSPSFSTPSAVLLAVICVTPVFGSQAPGHDHVEVGPHKGPLIELGEEEYHAEFVVDDKTGTVSIYLMDGAAKKYVGIPDKDITVTLKHDGKPESFKLAAKPQKTDAAGTSSLFSLKDKEFIEDLHHKGSDPRLTLKINGKPFSAKIPVGGHDQNPKK